MRDGSPIAADDRRSVVHPAHGTITGEEAVLLREAVRRARGFLPHLRPHAFPVVRMDERRVADRAAAELAGLVPEAPDVPGDVLDGPVLLVSPPEEHRGTVLDHHLRLPQRLARHRGIDDRAGQRRGHQEDHGDVAVLDEVDELVEAVAHRRVVDARQCHDTEGDERGTASRRLPAE